MPILRTLLSMACTLLPNRNRAIRLRPTRALAGSVRLSRFETLEDRSLLTTTLYIDFGAGIGYTNNVPNVYTTTARDIQSVDGPGITSDGTPAEGTGPFLYPEELADTPVYIRPLEYDYNRDLLTNNDDLTALASAVVPLVQRTLEPFDIDVVVTAASSMSGIASIMNSNDTGLAGLYGKHDAYVLVSDDRIIVDGMEFSLGTELLGLAARDDLVAQNGNQQDELAFVYADKALRYVDEEASPGETPEELGYTLGTPLFNAKLAQVIASTILHEACHTLGMGHTTIQLINTGDVIEGDPTLTHITIQNPTIVTRATLPHAPVGGNPVTQPNNYLLLANNSDIGLRNDDRMGAPNLAYVTGTGAFDKITLVRDASNANLVHVTVGAYTTSAFTTLIQQETYDINLTTDTEGRNPHRQQPFQRPDRDRRGHRRVVSHSGLTRRRSGEASRQGDKRPAVVRLRRRRRERHVYRRLPKRRPAAASRLQLQLRRRRGNR